MPACALATSTNTSLNPIHEINLRIKENPDATQDPEVCWPTLPSLLCANGQRELKPKDNE
jgi:hypothetical protein